MSRVAIFTDSASDLDPATPPRRRASRSCPLLVTFGVGDFKAGVDLSTAAFWDRMVAPDAPFPTTAASSPGDFKEAYEAAFAAGAEAIVSVHVAGTLSGTIKSAQIARDMLPDREIHVVDSRGASMAEGILARAWGSRLAADGRPAAGDRRDPRGACARTCGSTSRSRPSTTCKQGRPDQRRAGRHRDAAVGQADHQVKDGVVDTVDRVRTRSQGARAADRAHLRASDRAAGDPPHDQPGRRGVPRRGPRPRAGRARSGGRDDRPRRGLGRTAPRAGLRRRGGPLSGVARDRAGVGLRHGQRCGKVATALPTGTIGEARIAALGLYSRRT